LAKPNYQYEKRQRDLAKKLKKEEKNRQKLAGKTATDAGTNPSETTAAEDGSTAASPDSGSSS
jgi:hypothetical protein